MEQGTVAAVREDRGFGLIRPDKGDDDVFWHFSTMKLCGIAELRVGDRVEFEIRRDPRRGKDCVSAMIKLPPAPPNDA